MRGELLGVVFGLASAFIWGAGDFSGGLATRRSRSFQVLVLATASGLIPLLFLAVAFRERLPILTDVLWSAGAGICGAVGIALLYRGLAVSSAATVAPTTAVTAALVPVLVGSALAGSPELTQIAGFSVGLVGIGLVTRAASDPGAPGVAIDRQGLSLAATAGLGFGGFFVLIAQVSPGTMFMPLAVARAFALAAAVAGLVARREPFPRPWSSPAALLAGVLDAGGNLFYLLASNLTRFDLAAVLSSLYPAATVLLASLFLHERISKTQWAGVGFCLAAVALVAI